MKNARFMHCEVPGLTTPLWVVEFEAYQALSQLFRYVVLVHTQDAQFDPQQLVNRPFGVALRSQRRTQWFLGWVTQVWPHYQHLDRYYAHRLYLMPALSFLNQQKHRQHFLAKTVNEIVTEVLDKFPKQAYRWDLLTPNYYLKKNYCVQYEETHFHFISRLLESVGIFYYFLTDAKQAQLIFTDTNDSLPVFEHKVAVVAPALMDQPCIYQWGNHYRIEPNQYCVMDYDLTQIDPMITAYASMIDTPQQLKQTIFPLNTALSCQQAADLFLQRQQTQIWQIKAKSNVVGFFSGLCFHADQQYLITRIYQKAKDYSHLCQSDGMLAQSYFNIFYALAQTIPFRPLAITPQPKIYGHDTAVVAGPRLGQVYTNAWAQLRLQFRWMPSLGYTKACAWMPALQPWLGRSYGAHWQLRVGQQAVVYFLYDLPERVVVDGAIYRSHSAKALRWQPYDSGIQIGMAEQQALRPCHQIYFKTTAQLQEFHIIAPGQLFFHIDGKHQIIAKQQYQMQIKGDYQVQAPSAQFTQTAARAIEYRVGANYLLLTAEQMLWVANKVEIN